MTHSGAVPSATSAKAEGETDLASGRRVLRLEAEALLVLADELDGPFVAALDKLADLKGRVVVSGMGKSGHVGRKIAATLASTGTPAFYVHPAEASHGDLGMITPDDAVIALSNSGETAELSDVVAYTRRIGIPLIGITSKGESSLAINADVALVLPAMPEACPMGLAPTTSTTLMLALGDAIAVALLERKSFSAADFRDFHPGGKLGRRLLKVADLMHGADQVPLADPAMRMGDALVLMTAKSFGCVGIVTENRLAGIITDGDLRRHMAEDLLDRTAGQVMTAAPKTVGPNTLAAEALRIMNTLNITSLFVVDDGGCPIGILHVHDCLRAGVV